MPSLRHGVLFSDNFGINGTLQNRRLCQFVENGRRDLVSQSKTFTVAFVLGLL